MLSSQWAFWCQSGLALTDDSATEELRCRNAIVLDLPGGAPKVRDRVPLRNTLRLAIRRLVRVGIRGQLTDVFSLTGKHLPQCPLYPLHGILNLLSAFLHMSVEQIVDLEQETKSK
jgi:hypothetical protein